MHWLLRIQHKIELDTIVIDKARRYSYLIVLTSSQFIDQWELEYVVELKLLNYVYPLAQIIVSIKNKEIVYIRPQL